jgi:hypothetical protein
MSKKQLLLQAPKGMHDVLPGDAVVWDKVRAAVRHIADTYGFSRIETPTAKADGIHDSHISPSIARIRYWMPRLAPGYG